MMYLVIDADIARSSGVTEHPVSSSSRKLLDMVLNGEHCASFCSTLLSEWNKHQSAYTKRWRATMYSRKKVKIVAHGDETKRELQKLPETKMQKAAIKDSHLIDISNLSGKTVLSNDNTARDALSTLLSNSNLIDGVYWLSPLSCAEDVEKYVLKNKIIPAKHLLKP